MQLGCLLVAVLSLLCTYVLSVNVQRDGNTAKRMEQVLRGPVSYHLARTSLPKLAPPSITTAILAHTVTTAS